MLTKQSIVAALGEQALILPRLVNEALAANDRFKYRLSLLQLARRHADHPDAPLGDLRPERIAAHIDDARLDELPMSCRPSAGGYQWPALQSLLVDIESDIRAMLAPVLIAQPPAAGGEGQALEARAAKLLPPLLQQGGVFTAAQLDGWAAGDHDRGDGIHVLVMDLHRLLNHLQQAVATENLDGASIYELADQDRDRVRAFMRGIHRTSGLRFDHPGLGTTATHSGGRLVIQNDIGTTDAHVLVVHVDTDAVSITYTDVHLQRLLFFQDLLRALAVSWNDSRVVQDRQMADGLYHIAVGRFVNARADRLDGFLEHLGSRLVFLIDWNRARKQLRTLVSKKEAIRLLTWAAEHDVGHVAFLRVGGARAVFDAVDFATRGRGHFGQTLDELLGADRATRFLEFALRIASKQRLKGKSESLVHDELRAELARQLHDSNQSVLDLVCEHAGLIVEIAGAVRGALLGLGRAGGQEVAEKLAARCKVWESDADRVVSEVRDSARATPELAYLRDLVHQADDVADDLEEAAFLATLLKRSRVAPSLVAELAGLADRMVAGAQEFVKALETVRGIGAAASREDLQDFLEAIHRIRRVEHETDELKRRVATQLADGARGAQEIYLAAESAADLERAGDHLQHVALLLRDRVLAQLPAR